MTPYPTGQGQRLARIVAGLAILVTAVVTGACGSPTAQASPTTAASMTPAPSLTKPSTAATIATPPPSPQTYVVASGDTFLGIADRLGLTLDQLLTANPSITDPNRISIGEVIDIPTLSSTLVIEAASRGGPFETSRLHSRLGEEPTLRVAGDSRWVNETVYWQRAESATEPLQWLGNYSGVLDATGQTTVLAEQQDGPYVWRAYRAQLPASATHPELVSKPLVIEWGGTGPCPAEAVEHLDPPVVAPDGTTYELVPGEDSEYNSLWSIVASNIEGTPGTGWRHELEPCWEPSWPGIVVGSDATAYTTWSYRVGGKWTGDEPAELVVVGPEGVRTTAQSPGSIERAPDGTVFATRMEVNEEGPYELTFRSMTITALGPDGDPRAGWPFTTTDPSSWPTFGGDGTAYLAQATDSGDQIIALGPDGQIKPGWPYPIPGELEWTICGAGCANVPDAPLIAPDGALYDNFLSGVYLVGRDGGSRAGWPYALPKGTYVPSACRVDTPSCEGFDPVLTSDSRIYLPRTDGRYAAEHDDMMCLLADGALCPGWPVRLPHAVGSFDIDERGTVHLSLIDSLGSYPRIEIQPDGTIVE